MIVVVIRIVPIQNYHPKLRKLPVKPPANMPVKKPKGAAPP